MAGQRSFQTSLLVLGRSGDDGRLRKIIEGPADKPASRCSPNCWRSFVRGAGDGGRAAAAGPDAGEAVAAGEEQGGLTLDAYHAMGGPRHIVETAAAPIDQAIDADRRCRPPATDCSPSWHGHRRAAHPAKRAQRPAAYRPLRPRCSTLRSRASTDPDPEHVELAHETLLLHWPRLQQWCERYGEKLAIRRQGEHAAAEWARAGFNARPGSGPAPGHYLQWGWERQQAALQAMLALKQLDPEADEILPTPASTPGAPSSLISRNASALPAARAAAHARRTRATTPHTRREDIGRRLDQIRDPRQRRRVDADGIPGH